MIKVILVDDHKLVRTGIANILGKDQSGIEIVKEYDNVQGPLDNLGSDNCDIYLIDISLGKESGLKLAEKIKQKKKQQKIIVLSMFKKDYYLMQCVELDLNGYVHKDSEPAELELAVKKVAGGDKYYSSEMTHILINNVYTKSHKVGEISKITKREREIVKYIVEGYSSKEMAEALSISLRTVETHRNKILQKLGLKNTAELVKLAIEEELF